MHRVALLEEHRAWAEWLQMIEDKKNMSEIEKAVQKAHERLRGNAMLVVMFSFWRTWQQRKAIVRGDLDLAGMTTLQQILLKMGLTSCTPWTPPRLCDGSRLPLEMCPTIVKPPSPTKTQPAIPIDDGRAEGVKVGGTEKFFGPKTLAKVEEMLKMFAQFDKDNSGFIEASEMAALKNIFTIDEVDLNVADGKIDQIELLAALNKCSIEESRATLELYRQSQLSLANENGNGGAAG